MAADEKTGSQRILEAFAEGAASENMKQLVEGALRAPASNSMVFDFLFSQIQFNMNICNTLTMLMSGDKESAITSLEEAFERSRLQTEDFTNRATDVITDYCVQNGLLEL